MTDEMKRLYEAADRFLSEVGKAQMTNYRRNILSNRLVSMLNDHAAIGLCRNKTVEETEAEHNRLFEEHCRQVKRRNAAEEVLRDLLVELKEES